MIDWTTIVSTVLTVVLTGGGIGAIFLFRENKQKAKGEADKSSAEAIKEDAGAGKEMLSLLKETKDFLSEMNKYNQETNRALLQSVKEKDTTIDLMGKEVRELKYTVSTQQRQIEGMQKQIKEQESRSKYAEGLVCFEENCKLRRPDIGTFNSGKK